MVPPDPGENDLADGGSPESVLGGLQAIVRACEAVAAARGDRRPPPVLYLGTKLEPSTFRDLSREYAETNWRVAGWAAARDDADIDADETAATAALAAADEAEAAGEEGRASAAARPPRARRRDLDGRRRCVVRYVETSFVDAVSGEPDGRCFARDGLHLSARGYTAWNEIVAHALAEVLDEQGDGEPDGGDGSRVAQPLLPAPPVVTTDGGLVVMR